MTKKEFADSIIAEATKFNASQELLDALTNLTNEYKSSGKKNSIPEHPPILDDNGNIAELWCIKHLQYEPIDGFAKSTKGKTGYHNKCKVADLQWKDFLAQIKVLNKELGEAIIELTTTPTKGLKQATAKVAEIKSKIDEVTIAKDSPYTYPDSL